MNAQEIKPRQLQRLACLYVRQSTLQQVLENRESTARQYALRDRAIALGWIAERIVVLDQDLGHSGTSASDRVGFQRLVAEVGLGKVGLVLGLEVSRLARSSSDWHHLLEICALTGTLILDEDGLYDPATFNDRLLLGLKGTMSEAELYILRARLLGGILNKARRAELKLHLPIGFCYTEDNRVVLDPDKQAQATIKLLFQTFRRTGTASATVRAFRQQNLAFPRRLSKGVHKGELVWNDMRHDDVLRVLHNPVYAGAFVFGRTRTNKTADGKIHIVALAQEEWQVMIKDAHPAYISWEEYEGHLSQLRANSQAYTPKHLNPPREGPALLQGLVICGQCGERMTVRYHQRGGQRVVPDYVCQKAGISAGTAPCQRFLGRDLDAAIGQVLLEMLTPALVNQVLQWHAELCSQLSEAEHLRQMEVERAQYAADLAGRRFMRVDPDNRLVADLLEAEWNAKLRDLASAQQALAQQQQQQESEVSRKESEQMSQMLEQFPRFWNDPTTPVRERKRILRLVVSDVTVLKTTCLTAHIRFVGGATRSIEVALPPAFAQSRLTPVQTLAEIDRLLNDYRDSQVAVQMNKAGYKTFAGLSFTTSLVSALRRKHGLKDFYSRKLAEGWVSAEELARQLNVTGATIYRWQQRKLLEGVSYDERGSCLFRPLQTPLTSQARGRKKS
ncbi:MAG: recombinase family protein [Chloroflexi bacterium]|uniref:Recombinase family protein n=1 Tax=Candidatus Chlorohelix allophototropha TaxID=3003348 RepID=A0A8T7M4Z2_9CHLR|nr:recombinase family protein [Chloroflexota bacterium]WJW70296.1 recombinase family protein [Chloroflexota bacterium L227-S17]